MKPSNWRITSGCPHRVQRDLICWRRYIGNADRHADHDAGAVTEIGGAIVVGIILLGIQNNAFRPSEVTPSAS